MTKSAEGGCLCTAVRYRVTGTPLLSGICHCTSCRKAAGAPSVAWVTFEHKNFELLSGAPRSFESTPGIFRTFCGNCGTPLTYASDHSPATVDVTTISLDDPEAFPPTQEGWLEDHVSWEAIGEGRERRERGSSNA
jgi:hypothetical protein